jgi:hypothetical protein
MNRSALRAFLLIPLALACFALSPQARAVCQEGCLTNQNTVLGDDGLLNNTGMSNTAIGASALFSNTTGGFNTANGNQALQNNTTGSNNTANGNQALLSNITGNSNTGVGGGALVSNTAGQDNTAIGVNALMNNPGSNNTAIGSRALMNNNTGINNIALGFEAGIRSLIGNYNIDIGSPGLPRESKTIRIGNFLHTSTYIAGISGAVVPEGVGVIVDSNGKLGTTTSSARFKEAIKPMDKASEAILALKPVSFRYKKELDSEGIPQFGLVAEDVEKVNPDLVVRDEMGKAYTVRYEAVNAMLLNEFLKEHRKVAQLEATVVEQQRKFESRLVKQDKQIEALTSALQKVSAQLEMSRPAPRVVENIH